MPGADKTTVAIAAPAPRWAAVTWLTGAAPNLEGVIAKEVKRARVGHRIQLDSFVHRGACENALDRYFEFLPGAGAGHLIYLNDQVRDVTW